MVNQFAGQRFEEYLNVETRPWTAAAIPLLVSHYKASESWVGAEAILDSAPGMAGMGRRRGMGAQAGMGMQLVLADGQGSVIVDASGRYAGKKLSGRVLRATQPILVDWGSRGLSSDLQRPLVSRVLQSAQPIRAAGGDTCKPRRYRAGSTPQARRVKPLRMSGNAARRIGSGEFAHRIPVTSGDEVGDLGTAVQ